MRRSHPLYEDQFIRSTITTSDINRPRRHSTTEYSLYSIMTHPTLLCALGMRQAMTPSSLSRSRSLFSRSSSFSSFSLILRLIHTPTPRYFIATTNRQFSKSQFLSPSFLSLIASPTIRPTSIYYSATTNTTTSTSTSILHASTFSSSHKPRPPSSS